MAKLIFSMNQSLDGFVDHMKMGPPEPAAFRHFVNLTLSATALLYGRRLYEIMRYWEEDLPDWEADEREFAAAWRAKPKWVVSHTLEAVGPNATLIATDVETAIRRLKTEHEGEIHVGGPVLAASLTKAGLIDEYRLYMRPLVLGSGTPFFIDPPPPLRLVATDRISENIIRLSYIPA